MLSTGQIVSPERGAQMRETPADPPAFTGTSGSAAVRYEHNVKLADGAQFARYREMEANPAIAIGVGLADDLMLSATVGVDDQPADGADPKAVEDAAELLRLQFGLEARQPRMHESWESLLPRLARAQRWGCGAHAFDVRSVDGTWWIDLHEIEPEAWQGYIVDSRERLCGLRYYTASRFGGGGAGFADLAAHEMLYQRWKGSQKQYEGWGLYRSLWADARDREKCAGLAIAGAQKLAIADIQVDIDIEVARLQQAIPTDQTPEEWYKAEEARAWQWIRERAAGLHGGIVKPKWWTIALLGGDAASFDPAKLRTQIDGYDATIFRQFRAQFLALGGNGVGSTIGDVHMDAAEQAIANLYRWILGDLNRQVVAPFLRWNMGDRLAPDHYPQLRVDGLKASAFQVAVDKLEAANRIGLYFPEDADEDAFRRANDLPDRTVDRTQFDRARVNAMQTQAGQIQRTQPARVPNVNREAA